MKNPRPVHLQTSAEIRAGGWLAEARDVDGHVMTVISPEASDESLGQFMRECTRDGLTVTAFPALTSGDRTASPNEQTVLKQ